MTLLNWSQAFELDIQQIDEQHHTLVDIINDLNDQILKGGGTAGCAHALQRMNEYALDHLAHEEELMLQSGYTYMAYHQQLHAQFIKSVDDFSAEDCQHNPDKAMAVLDYLQEWLVDHILGPDLIFAKHYKAWAENNG